MVIVLVIVILIMAAMVTTKLTTLVTSAGTFVLGECKVGSGGHLYPRAHFYFASNRSFLVDWYYHAGDHRCLVRLA
jgi:hypothetical protein